MEHGYNVSRVISVTYCILFSSDLESGKYYNMSSFVETRLEKIVKNKHQAASFVMYPSN